MAITPEDQQTLVDEINQIYQNTSPLIRGFIPPIPTLLRKIPECAWKYTLGELIEFLEKAHNEGKIP